MAIYIGGKEITAVTAFGKAITAIYAGGKLMWQAVRSCFGAGHWRNDKPWLNDEAWRDE